MAVEREEFELELERAIGRLRELEGGTPRFDLAVAIDVVAADADVGAHTERTGRRRRLIPRIGRFFYAIL